jgi:4-hydroxy-tetrahydrodipicolinate synthase
MQVRFLIDGGIRLIVPCGGTGEFFSLSFREWQALLEVALNEAKGHGVTIIPSVGGALNQAVQMARVVERLGCEVMQLTFLDPMFGVTEEGIYEYNRRVAQSVSVGVMLYKPAGIPMSLSLAVRMCTSIPNVVAFKDEAGDVKWFRQFVLEVGDQVAAVCGGGESMAPYYLLAGASAFTTGIANLVPHLSSELYHAVSQGRWETVFSVQQKLSPLCDLRRKPGRMIPVIKEGLKIIGLLDDAHCRPPLVPLTGSERAELRGVLQNLGLC